MDLPTLHVLRDGDSAQRSRPRVLLAEDDDDLRSLIATTMRIDGLDVVEAVDGSECLLALAEASADGLPAGHFDLLVSDVRMPGYSGMGVLAAVSSAHLRLPVVLITAYSNAAMLAVAEKLGVTLFLRKPFDLNELRQAVLRAVRRPDVDAEGPDPDGAGDSVLPRSLRIRPRDV